MSEENEGLQTIRESLFGACIGKRILDITTGDMGTEDWNKVYFHLDDGQTFYTTIGDVGENMMGFLDMEGDGDDEEQAA